MLTFVLKKPNKDDASRFNNGAPGQTSAAEKGPEQVVNPKQKTGTIKENDDQGPTNLGDARKLSKVEICELSSRSCINVVFSLGERQGPGIS